MHFSGMVTQYGTLPTLHILNLSPFQNRNTWLVTVSMFPLKQCDCFHGNSQYDKIPIKIEPITIAALV